MRGRKEQKERKKGRDEIKNQDAVSWQMKAGGNEKRMRKKGGEHRDDVEEDEVRKPQEAGE